MIENQNMIQMFVICLIIAISRSCHPKKLAAGILKWLFALNLFVLLFLFYFPDTFVRHVGIHVILVTESIAFVDRSKLLVSHQLFYYDTIHHI